MNTGRPLSKIMLALAACFIAPLAFADTSAPLVPDSPLVYLPVYLDIDGHWYQFNAAQPGESAWSWYGSFGSIAWTTTAANCRREDGGWIGTEPPMMYYGPSAFGIPITFFFYRLLPNDPSKGWMHYTTRYGNVICDNEIPSPIPDEIFGNGFERTGPLIIPGDTIFANWFEGH